MGRVGRCSAAKESAPRGRPQSLLRVTSSREARIRVTGVLLARRRSSPYPNLLGPRRGDDYSGHSNSKGIVKQTIKMNKAGILIFSPIASKRCNTKRVGVTNVFTPPVTG